MKLTKKKNSKLDSGIIQLAYIVDDIHTSMGLYTQQLGIGPWFLFKNFAFETLTYRGQPSELSIDLALGYSNGMMFELIQQNDDTPSVYLETFKKRGWGFHHWGVKALPSQYDSMVCNFLDKGYALAIECVVGVGSRAAYMDPGDELAGMIEIIEVTPVVEGLFAQMELASVDWDGADPVRLMGGP
jgi:Glyoxalase/Bleomycin resistance protein/Dioxygenase superfamily